MKRPDGVPVSAEAIFGSAARGDADQISDRDYLIVCDDIEALKSRTRELSASGWSVASYTFRKIQALSKNGALFVQHLKDEAQLIHDVDDRLSTLLHEFLPKKSYSSEIYDNAKLANLISTRPSGAAGALWASDVLYVSTRNFGILKLAEFGLFKFSFRDIIASLIGLGILDQRAAEALLALRFYKALYRSGSRGGESKVSESIDKALEALPKAYFPEVCKATSSDEILHQIAGDEKISQHYHRLRTIEKALIAGDLIDRNWMDHSERCKLDRWIRDPRCYSQATATFDFARLANLLQNSASLGSQKRAIS